MSSRNIDRFNEITGLIFACLYEKFPVPVDLHPMLFGIKETPGGAECAAVAVALELDPQSEDEIFFKHSVRWLIEAGYLASAEYSYGSTHFGDSRLTAKGLEVLNAVPTALVPREPLGEQLVAASKSGGKELVRNIATEALGVGVRLSMKAFGIDS